MDEQLLHNALRARLAQLLPPELHPVIPQLAPTLVAVLTEAISPDAARQALTADPGTALALAALEHTGLNLAQMTWPLAGLQAGDITIGDVAGHNIIKPTVYVGHVAYYQPGAQPPDRNRAAMLQKVRSIWIDGLLVHTVSPTTRIDLHLEGQPDATVLPLNAHYQELHHPVEVLVPGTPIIQVFTRAAGSLLILGAPGAGKTTLLLELCRDLLDAATSDAQHPIPVVFNLASWAKQREPLETWLVEELRTRYAVPHRIAQAWVTDDGVLPLLDGLDEMAPANRDGCVRALNAYRQRHGLTPLVVAARSDAYAALPQKLELAAAILVRPLSQNQLDAYLTSNGPRLGSLQATLQQDPALSTLADTPLMLSVMARAYQRMTPSAAGGVSAEERRRQVWEAYIAAMFARRQAKQRYSQMQTRRWLGWLARTMAREQLSIFSLEDLQHRWLPTRVQRVQYLLIFELIYSTVVGVLAGAALGIPIAVAIVQLEGGPAITLLVVPALSGLLCTAVMVPVGLLTFWLPWTGRRPIVSAERLRWRRAHIGVEARRWWGCVAPVSALSLLFALIGVISLVQGGDWFTAGLCIAFAITLLSYGLLGLGLRADEAVDTRTRPNQGTWRSPVTGLRAGLVLSLPIAVMTVLFGVYFGGLPQAVAGIGAALFFGATAGFVSYGGIPFLQHFALRAVLALNGHLPWNLVAFLDACTDRILLHRIGGSYIFVHRLLLEHIAFVSDRQTLTPTHSDHPDARPADSVSP